MIYLVQNKWFVLFSCLCLSFWLCFIFFHCLNFFKSLPRFLMLWKNSLAEKNLLIICTKFSYVVVCILKTDRSSSSRICCMVLNCHQKLKFNFLDFNYYFFFSLMQFYLYLSIFSYNIMDSKKRFSLVESIYVCIAVLFNAHSFLSDVLFSRKMKGFC